MNRIKKIFNILSAKEKKGFYLIVIFGIFSSLLDVTGLVSILPLSLF